MYFPQETPILPGGRFSNAWLRYFQNLHNGGGGITSISIVPANGVSGTVGGTTTAAAITLSLGGITPTSVTSTGPITGANLSGTNTGDQTSVPGNAGTATALQNARHINGVLFNGTADITVPADARTLTGDTLPVNVIGSFLTSVATVSIGTWQATVIAGQYGGTGVNNSGKTITLGGNLTTSGAFASTFTMTGVTSVTFPTSGTLATLAGSEALANKTITGSSFSGTTVVASTSVLSSGTGGVGYSAGAGGTVTQATSKSTGVTLSKACGQVTMNPAALAAGTSVSFTLTNSLIAATDTIDVHRASGGTDAAYNVWVDSVAAGSCVICVRNISGTSLAEAVVLNFSICKAVNA